MQRWPTPDDAAFEGHRSLLPVDFVACFDRVNRRHRRGSRTRRIRSRTFDPSPARATGSAHRGAAPAPYLSFRIDVDPGRHREGCRRALPGTGCAPPHPAGDNQRFGISRPVAPVRDGNRPSTASPGAGNNLYQTTLAITVGAAAIATPQTNQKARDIGENSAV